MKRGIRRVPALWRASRLLRRWYHARSDAYPDWPAILAKEPELWEEARRTATGGQRVLMASSIGSYAHAITLESALAAALNAPAARGEPSASEVIAHTLTAFNCYACHERGKVGGVEAGLNAFFTTTQPEMGDEGRLPPPLNGVGAKLNPTYLRKVLDQGADDRPYMHTRMPGFGNANVGHLVALLDQLDKDINLFGMRIREWYSYHYPELYKIVGDQYKYVRCAVAILDRNKSSEDPELPAKLLGIFTEPSFILFV